MAAGRTVAQILVGADGKAYVGATTAAAPTTSGSTIDGGFSDLGWISEDGLVSSSNTSSNDIKTWDGVTARKVITDTEFTFKVKFLQTSKYVLELFHAGSTMSGSKMDVKKAVQDHRSFIFDVFDGTIPVRIYIASGEVTEQGDITYANGEAIAYEVTITAYPSATGVTHTKFFSTAFLMS